MTSDPIASHLVCRIGKRLCAIPIAQVLEIMRPQPLEPLPGGPDFVLGLSLIRGAPMPIVDLGLLLSSEPAETPSRIVVLRTGDHHVGMAVDEVSGVRDLPPGALSGSPPLTGEAFSGAIATIGRLDSELLVVLASTRLIPEQVWSAMAEGRP